MKRLIGPSQADLYHVVSQQVGGSVVQTPRGLQIVIGSGIAAIVLDTHKPAPRGGTLALRVRAPYHVQRPFAVALRRPPVLFAASDAHLQRISAGVAEIDACFIVAASDAALARALVSAAPLQTCLLAQPELQLTTEVQARWYGAQLPPNVQLLQALVYGLPRDPERFVSLIRLVHTTRQEFQHLGIAVPYETE